MKDWSQYKEQQVILDFFGDRTGAFLDVGAHAAAENSNTRALMERGWGGVCVEPSPTVFLMLLTNTEPFPKVTCVNAAVGSDTGLEVFYASPGGDQIGTTESAHRDKWAANGYPFTRAFYIPTIRFYDVHAVKPFPFHFLNIDTEGSSFRVLQSAPLIEMGVELLCVERFDVNTDNAKPISDYLSGVGYKVIAETAGNLLAALNYSLAREALLKQ